MDPWQYDEMKQVGTDYGKPSEVESYDEKMQKLRNIKSETQNIIKLLGIGSEHTILEIGTGTGEFALSAANVCKKVIALDVSSTMLEYAKEKAAKRGICNLEFYNAGFLTYEHKGDPVDAVFSQLALHHLPDFWKLIALQKIHGILKYQGRLYLGDVVFSFPIEEYTHKIDNWIDTMREKGGVDFAKEADMHIKEEFSTFDWVMEEILNRAGFNIDEKDYIEGFMAVYICTKTKREHI